VTRHWQRPSGNDAKKARTYVPFKPGQSQSLIVTWKLAGDNPAQPVHLSPELDDEAELIDELDDDRLLVELLLIDEVDSSSQHSVLHFMSSDMA
jgi:hypothetical protein